LIGLAIGDAVGNPLEFASVEQTSSCGVLPGLENGQLCYQSPMNTFRLHHGQWADDCSMALCLADSLLAHGSYHGGDVRVRWHMWWYHGYCNAFRHDDERSDRRSVGGHRGNLGESLREIEKWAPEGDPFCLDDLPGVFSSENDDSGNGSIMRIAPVPIAWHAQMAKAMSYAELQSRATHQCSEASACCRFMSFFIVSALNANACGLDPTIELRKFIVEKVDEFLSTHLHDCDQGQERLRALLSCNPPGPAEANWDWQQDEIAIADALAARKASPNGIYNGHPVRPCHFGSYCMDGLAMALWALWHSADFSTCIQRVVNLLGHADTTGAIAGQLAGALYGWRGIASSAWGRACLANLQKWDPYAEVGLRAALLYNFGPGVQASPFSRRPSAAFFADLADDECPF